MYNIEYQLVTPLSGQQIPFPGSIMSDRALINQRLQALMNMSCLRLRGLPFSASHKDILNFLGCYKDNVVGTVHIIYNLQGRPSGEAFVQLQTPDQAHQCSNDRHLKHMGERYIEVFQCSVQDMTWMLATSHANQLASQQLNHANKNNANFLPPKPTTFHQQSPPTFHPSTPSPPPIIRTTSAPSIIAPPQIPASSGMLSPISPIPIYTGQYPHMISPIPAGFLPHPHMPHPQPPHGIPPYVLNHDPYFQMNHYGKPSGVTYIAFAPPEEGAMYHHHHNNHIHKHNIGNRYVEMFYAH